MYQQVSEEALGGLKPGACDEDSPEAVRQVGCWGSETEAGVAS